MKRYSLVLPTELFDDVQAAAKKRAVTFKAMIVFGIRLGLQLIYWQREGKPLLIRREGQPDERLIIL